MTFQLAGASSAKPTRFASIWQSRFFHGLWTQRNPLGGAASHLEEKFYPTYDAMIDGSNVEISNRLTPIRRPGNSQYNSQSFTGIDAFYNFNLFNSNSEQIKVIVDTSAAIYDGTGPSNKNLIFTKSAGAGQAFFQSVGNELFFGDGVDQKKWVQTLTVWTASTAYSVANGNTEDPYEAGTTGPTQPTFATGINQLTNDNPNLIWINQGPASAPPAGTISASSTQGRIYYVALVNTLTNTVSNGGIASVQTGPFVGATGVLITGGLPAVPDPQADYVAVFRTEDGGAIPFLIPGTGNTVYTIPIGQYQANGYTDTTLDSGLNILLQAAINGQNTPPGVGAINPAQHLNRIFFSIGNVVYWTAGPNTPIGNGFEGVPPINNATFPSLVKRLVPTSVGLFVYTVSDIYMIAGNGTLSSPLFPVPYLPGKGILSYNALAINGTLVYVFTTSNAVMVIDPSVGFSDMGFPVGDQFTKSNWNAANVYLTWHEYGEDVALYVADGTSTWLRCNPTPSPEQGNTWAPIATIVGGMKAVTSIEVSPGVRKLLIGPTGTGAILARDRTTNADNGTAYTAFFTIGSLVLAQPGQLAEVGFITTDSKAIGTRPAISVLMGEISGTFDPLTDMKDDPPQLAPSQTTYANRYSLLSTANGTPALCRHCQIRVDWPAENQPNEMLSMSVFGGFASEK